MPNPTTPAQYLLILISLVEQRGFPRARLLEGTALADSSLDTLGARVNDSDFTRVAGNAITLTGDPGLGLELGLNLNLGAHATLGQAFMTCRDLGQALDLFSRYYHLLAPNLELAFDSDANWTRLLLLSEPAPGEALFYYESLFGAIVNTLRTLLADPDLSPRLDLPYPAPAHARRYYATFGDDIRFDSPQAAVSFPNAWLAQALPTSNPALKALYERECARLLADLEETASVAEQTQRLLRKLEGCRRCSISAPAPTADAWKPRVTPTSSCWTRCAPSTPPATCAVRDCR